MDNHASTPTDPEVLETFVDVARSFPGNPASTDSLHGAEAHARLEKARTLLSEALDSKPREVVWTSGATESNNLAIQGAARAMAGSGLHIVTSRVEHSSVLEVCRHLEMGGWRVTYLDPESDGTVSPDSVERAMDGDTVLVSVMAANNEVGTINDTESISRIAHAHGAIFHCDATQAIGMCEISFDRQGIDLLSLSGHKVYAPRGTGALLVRTSGRRVRLQPVMYGGGHERGLRPGTVNVAGAASLAAAVAKSVRVREAEVDRMAALRDRMWDVIVAGVPGVLQNGALDSRLPGNLSIHIPGVEGKALVAAVRRTVSVSAGSACATEHVEPSHVLLAMGQSPTRAFETIRIGIGRFNTAADVATASDDIVRQALALRRLSASSHSEVQELD
jgi:cysteine desulfurase